MKTERIENLPSTVRESPVRVVGSIGLGEKLLSEKGNLKPYNSWYGITPREKAYPDSQVLNTAKWGSKNSKSFLIIIADGLVLSHNFIAFANRKIDYTQMYELKNEFTKVARKRKEKVAKLLYSEGLTNASVKLWNEVLKEISADEYSTICLHMADQALDVTRYQDAEFEQKLRNISKEKVGDELERAMKRKGKLLQVPIMGYALGFRDNLENAFIDAMVNSGDPEAKKQGEKLRAAKIKMGSECVEFAAASYTKEEIFMIWAMATIGNYPIKVGPPGERVYDEFTLNLIREGKPIEMKSAQFGAVYLDAPRSL